MNRQLFRFWLLVLIVKLTLAAILPLSGDEAYYWVWSHHLQLSYFDHPGMIAWLFWLGHPLEGLGQAVRWPAVLVGHLGIWVWLLVFEDLLTQSQLNLFFWLLVFAPLTGPGSLIVTPDLPLMFFWACSLYCFKKLIQSESLWWSLAFGLCLGLGFSSKYQIVIFVLIALAWALAARQWRLFNWKKILLTVSAGLLGSAPVLIWNWQHHFVSFAFQLHHGLGHTGWSMNWMFDYLLGQVALIFPVLVYFAIIQSKKLKPSWPAFFAWGPLIFFGLSSLKGPVEANWPIVAYPSVLALAASYPRWRSGIIATIGIWASAILLVSSQILHPWVPVRLNWRLEDYKLYHNVEALTSTHQPLYANSYQMAAQMSYDLHRSFYKLRGLGRHDFFDELPESEPHVNHFFLAAEKETQLPKELRERGAHIVKRTSIDHLYDLIEVEQN